MAYTKEQAKKEIQKLVENFRNNEKALEKAPEAQIENNYIKPLFRFLNWNVENTGLSPNDQEFVVQNTIRATGKRPDYLLRLNGQSVLFMDAKAVHYDMHDNKLLNQIYAYGYSTQNNQQSRRVDFAILTDFQEFVVLDCTLYAKNPEIVNRFRILDWKYTNYLDKFDELWSLLEKNNVTEALKTRNSDARTGLWARYLTPQKVNANRIAPDISFLSSLDDPKTGWRVILAKDIKKHNPDADGELITTAVQLLIDRIVFMKVLADREIEDDYLDVLFKYLSEKHKDGEGFNKFRQISVELNEKYNGSVFEERDELTTIAVSNNILFSIVNILSLQNTPYNFSELPIEILGTIYERFLGKVIRTTDHQVKIDDKPEVRHAGGVYYTPQYIVDYIVKNTLDKLLEKCKSPKDVEKIKILDPACGSGSFLLGAYSKLVDWYKQYYLLNPQKSRCHVYCDGGKIRLKAKLKQKILLDNIHGVDIDKQAVEVTKLSLSMKMLEELSQGELYNEIVNLYNKKMLPDLSENIKCGNSLIESDYFSQKNILIDNKETKKINAFDWNKEFTSILQHGGFDIVLGNPPWISLTGRFRNDVYREETIRYLITRYSGNEYMPNVYEYFITQGLTLTRNNGYFSFIVPDRLGFNEQFINLRKRIILSTQIISLKYKTPFPGVTVDTLIFVLNKKKRISKEHKIFTSENNEEELFQILQSSYYSDPSCKFYYRTNGSKLVEKINNLVGILPLSKYCNSTSGFGGKSKLIFEEKQNDEQILTFKGDSINRYQTKKTYWFDFKKENITGRTTDKSKLGYTPKILIRKTGDKIIATYDDTGTFPEQSLYFLYNVQDDIGYEYLLGILNSKLLSFYFRLKSITNKNSFAQVKKIDLDDLPILLSPQKRDELKRLVEKILIFNKSFLIENIDTNKKMYKNQIEATDKEIDRLVYELYGLTKEEIEIVEKEVGS